MGEVRGVRERHHRRAKARWSTRRRRRRRRRRPALKAAAMVFLDALVNFGCRKYLHKEDYDFDESTETVKSSVSYATSSPSQYFVLGFKDRNLEAEYWNDVTLTSEYRILLGWFVSTLLFLVGIFLGETVYIRWDQEACNAFKEDCSYFYELLGLAFTTFV